MYIFASSGFLNFKKHVILFTMKLYSDTKIQKVATRIAKEYNPEKIILFGSYAWGKPTFDSDVDFFIVKKTI